MPTFNLKRFASPETLKAVAPERLLAFLMRFKEYFKSRGVVLSASSPNAQINYETLVDVLIAPDDNTPREMVDALYFVNEMATPEAMDSLLDAAEDPSIDLGVDENSSPADVAVATWLINPDLLERQHAEQFLTHPRSFQYYQTASKNPPKLGKIKDATLRALERSLDEWFLKKKRGTGSKVFEYPRGNAVWFLVRHGEPYKREGSFNNGQSGSVFYRPEKFDVLVYEQALSEIRVNAGTKGERELYRMQFGRHLFGDDNFFPGTGKYTLDPLRADDSASLACGDVDGIDKVTLVEARIFWGGAYSEIEIRRADDLFAVYQDRGRSLPEKARLTQATFEFKFTDAKTPRRVTIKPSNVALYTRDQDSSLVEEWLNKRGFIKSEPEGVTANAKTDAPVAID